MPPAALPHSVWIVEDDAEYRRTLAEVVGLDPSFRVDRSFADAEGALEAVSHVGALDRPSLVLMDVNLPGASGIEATSSLKSAHPDSTVVMLTGRDEPSAIFAALRAGASGYLIKGEPIDRVVAALREAASGGVLLPAAVAERVLGFFASQPSAETYGLSPRERDVLDAMVDGLAQQAIADRLFISASTVNKHVQRVYQKLHVHSASAAVAKAVRERLVVPSEEGS